MQPGPECLSPALGILDFGLQLRVGFVGSFNHYGFGWQLWRFDCFRRNIRARYGGFIFSVHIASPFCNYGIQRDEFYEQALQFRGGPNKKARAPAACSKRPVLLLFTRTSSSGSDYTCSSGSGGDSRSRTRPSKNSNSRTYLPITPFRRQYILCAKSGACQYEKREFRNLRSILDERRRKTC